MAYRVNPQTVFFVGYSGTSVGGTGPGGDRLDLTTMTRTFFAKIGYGWRP